MVLKRKCKLFNKRTMAALMCGVIFLSAPQVGNASSRAFMGQPSQKANVAVNIATDCLIVDIVVPGTVSFAFNADGSNEIPDNFNITNNNKIASFYLKKLDVFAYGSGWKIASKDQSIAMDEKAIKMSVGAKGFEKEITPANGTKDTIGSIIFEKTDFVLPPVTPTNMSFLVERPVYTDTISETKAFDMSMEFEMM